MMKLTIKNQWVLITGASSGLGAEIARQLARDYACNLVLMARRENKLNALKSQLEKEYAIECEVVLADLSDQSSYADVFENLSQFEIKAAILNAGITYFDEDITQSWRDFQSILSTNVSSVVYFTRAFANYFEARKSDGAILVIGSMAGLTPVPYQAAYSGSKAFLNHYCQAVQQELNKKPYSLSLFAPGGIDTEMNHGSGLALTFSDSVFVQPVASCAKDALDTLINRKILYVPKVLNRLQVLLVKLFPRFITIRFTTMAYRKAWLNKKAGFLPTQE